MLKDSDYVLAHSHESYYKDKPLGVRIYIAAGNNLTERANFLKDTERVAYNAGEDLFNAVLKQHVMLDEDVKKSAVCQKAEILQLFEGKTIFVEEIPNEYGGKDPWYSLFPWFIVTTPIGHIKIGWRKRVINIDWTHTTQKECACNLFPNEDVTKGEYYIHAWGYEKAKEYLDIIHKEKV